VTLPKAPWDKKKEKSEMTDNEKTRSMAKADKKVGVYKPAKRPDDEMREGGMKRMSTGDGMDTFKKKPPEKKEAFSSRAIVKKPRAGDGKPMSNKPMVRSNSPEHKDG